MLAALCGGKGRKNYETRKGMVFIGIAGSRFWVWLSSGACQARAWPTLKAQARSTRGQPSRCEQTNTSRQMIQTDVFLPDPSSRMF